MPQLKSRKPLVSVIIPAYKQAKTILRDLENIERVLQRIRYNYEMIVVVDGMIDKTFENAKKASSKKIKVFSYEKNHGKGHAVRYGMARAKGNIIAFIDAGMDLNPNSLSMLLEHFEWYDADIVVGSKRHQVSKVNYPWQRKITSWGYQIITRALFSLNIRDTQTGMKFFRREVLEDVLPRLLVKTFAFDIEILAVAYRLGYRRIYEAPIELYWKKNTIDFGNLLKFSFNVLWDTLAVFYRLKILRYYDDHNRRKWVYDPDLNFRVNIG